MSLCSAPGADAARRLLNARNAPFSSPPFFHAANDASAEHAAVLHRRMP